MWKIVGVTMIALLMIVMASVAIIPVEAAPNGIPEYVVVSKAYSWLGVPYKYGGTGRKGIDCSWLVYRVYSEAGSPYGAHYSYRNVENIRKASQAVYSPRPGDLILFQEKSGPDKGKWTHVGIYIGQVYRNGRWDICFIHASAIAGKVVQDYLYDSPYYGKGYLLKRFNVQFVRYNPDYWRN
jgi:cell wall-associated NlpC family hydrolase